MIFPFAAIERTAPAQRQDVVRPRPGIHALDILGVRVHSVTLKDTLQALDSMASDGGTYHVVTVNPEFIMTARSHDRFRTILNEASIALPDGMGIVWASRLLGGAIAERVTGVDVVYQFAGIAARRGYRLYLLGAAPGVAEQAASVLQRQNPDLQIAGTYAGSPREDENEEICSRILAASPHVLLVAYGSPQQDLWIKRNRERLKVPVSIGVGGTFDYIAGVIPRAPRVFQRLGLEWLYRLTRQPERWRRMLVLPHFALLVFRSALAGNEKTEG
jgi:N-acetylglucosaminyldiphosphoundecaprenol N-acetyl-beta-D-mannosaminyltransferase